MSRAVVLSFNAARMKILPAAFFTLTNGKSSGWRNFSQLIKLVVIVLMFVALSTAMFHWLMEREGQ